MRIGISLSLGAARAIAAASPILWQVDFTGLTPGPITAGALLALGSGGLVLTRASVATVETVQDTTIDTTPGVDVPRVEYGGGLLVEEARVNAQYYSSQVNSWSGASFVGTVTADASVAPDGTTTADRIQWTGAGAYNGKFTSANGAVLNLPLISSIWVKHLAGSSDSMRSESSYSGRGVINTDGSIKTWKKYDAKSIASGVVANVGARALGAALPDVYVWGAMVSNGSYPQSYIVQSGTTSGTQAGERLYHGTLATLVNGGRLSLYVSISPLGASTEQTGNVRVWTSADGDYAEVNATTRVLTVVIGGVTRTLGALPTWARRDTLEIYIAAGGGALTTVASARVNGGATTDLGSGAAQGSITGASLDFVCNGTASQFSSLQKNYVAYNPGYAPAWAASAGA